jgi:hypothetical protein
MTKHKHQKSTIEINGKIYDPHTGREVGPAGPIKPASAAKSIDGVVGRVPIQNQPLPNPKPQPPSHQQPVQPVQHRPMPKHAQRQPDRSRTLVRQAVAKPAAGYQNSRPESSESAMRQDLKERAERAKQIQKSRLVQKFNPRVQPEGGAITPKRQPLEVAKPQKQHQAGQHQTARFDTAVRSAAKPARNSIKDFENAIENATSHLEKMPKKSRKSRLKPKANKTNIAMASIAAILLMGFFAWQNIPNLQMRLAASRADIPASLPGYSPAGYSAGDIQSEPGKVTVSFSSRTDDSAFTVTEQASEWNTETLYANYVEPRDGQIYESGDKKLYLINNSNATWVDNGIWYRIEGSSDLTTDQLSRIANSL